MRFSCIFAAGKSPPMTSISATPSTLTRTATASHGATCSPTTSTFWTMWTCACRASRCIALSSSFPNESKPSSPCATVSTALSPLPNGKWHSSWIFRGATYSAATNVNDARRAERLPGHQCLNYLFKRPLIQNSASMLYPNVLAL